tara:strand:+ start:530 stop:889 length:360 start_codon:yes stop_codon:yes gene_type:complete
MIDFNKLNTENIIALASGLATVFALLNDKVRSFLLSKLTFLKSKAETKKDTSSATDAMLDTMMNRINVLSVEYVELSEKNSLTQKENFELMGSVNELNYKIDSLNDAVTQKCKNNCLDV